MIPDPRGTTTPVGSITQTAECHHQRPFIDMKELAHELSGKNFNAINYIKSIYEATHQYPYPDHGFGTEIPPGKLLDIRNDIATACLETTRAALSLPFSYNLYLGENGDILSTGGQSMRDIYRESISQAGSQLPTWHRERDLEELNFLALLEQKAAIVRSFIGNGEITVAPEDVEQFDAFLAQNYTMWFLSPNPGENSGIDPKDARRFGYFNMDSIRSHVFSYNPDSNQIEITVDTHWLPGGNLGRLAAGLVQEEGRRADCAVMNMATTMQQNGRKEVQNVFTDFTDRLEATIGRHNAITAEVSPILQNYIERYITPDIDTWYCGLTDRVGRATSKSDIIRLTEEVALKIASVQQELKLVLEDLQKGKDITERAMFASLSPIQQTQYMIAENFVAQACAGSFDTSTLAGRLGEGMDLLSSSISAGLGLGGGEFKGYKCPCGTWNNPEDFVDRQTGKPSGHCKNPTCEYAVTGRKYNC